MRFRPQAGKSEEEGGLIYLFIFLENRVMIAVRRVTQFYWSYTQQQNGLGYNIVTISFPWCLAKT